MTRREPVEIPTDALRERRAPVRVSVTGHSYSAAVARARKYLTDRGMRPSEVQEAVFASFAEPAPLLVVAPTGSGKTAAVMLPLLALLDDELRATSSSEGSARGVRVLYLAPVRALVTGHGERIREMIDGMGSPLRVGVRTGDTSSSERARILRSPPEILTTTPETLGVILGTDARRILANTRAVVLDEVHILAAGKRGALLSATLEILDALVRQSDRPPPRRVAMSATVHPIETLAAWVSPETRVVRAGGGLAPALDLADPVMDAAFPSAGWTWRTALPTVARRVAKMDGTSLVFVGARARAEQWTLALRDVLPARMSVACFHGSLSPEERAAVADGLAQKALRAVVATSGLEAGVDLPSVTQVMVVSSPPSVTRLLQAAGRADHRPGCAPRATVIPTSAHDLVRCAAVVRASRRGEIEPVEMRAGDLDVAVQAALGCIALGPCTRDDIGAILRRSWSFRDLDDRDLDAVLGFLHTGGDALAAYPEMSRAVTDGSHWALASKRSLRKYLQQIGTIVGDVTVTVRHGQFAVGQIEGRFAALLEPGDVFVLAARTWSVVSRTGDELQVRPAPATRKAIPSWGGTRASASEVVSREEERVWAELDDALKSSAASERVERVRAVLATGEENARAVVRLLRAQAAVSKVPRAGTFLIEVIRAKGVTHLVAFTYAGSVANEVIARAVAARIRRSTGSGAQVSALDDALCVSFESARKTFNEPTLRAWFSPERLEDDLNEAFEGSVLAGALFREVARVAQLWAPDGRRGAITPGLLYDVLRKYDPKHVLLRALAHTLWTALDGARAVRALTERASQPIHVATLRDPSPLAIPVFVWATRDQVAPDDPENALVAAAHALFQRAAAVVEDDA
jgi:ATP-dependent Lhr-like helicase